jgi:predicted RNA polymerase sigma factor
VSAAFSQSPAGYYQLQAAIAAVHDEAGTVEDTDWPQILALYTALESITDNPMVKLNRAIAVAMVESPEVAMNLLAGLDDDPRIAGHYRLDAVRGHLQEMAGDLEGAVRHYQAASERTSSLPERNYLLTKAARAKVCRERQRPDKVC